ncbi:MAG: alpha/beta fold hydrolase [Gammaproteobacteria bacterium]|nr:alpha/beta fold hydrolase [Gammaproteobacteria bacterium]
MSAESLPVDAAAYPAPAQPLARRAEKFVTPCGSGTMSWHVWGEGEPLVLLHGGSGSWTHWLRNLDELARQHRVFAADLPGLGESDEAPRRFDPTDLMGSVAHWAELVGAGIEQLTAGPFHLAGFSLGSIIGARMAAQQWPAIRSLTVIGGASMGMPWAGLRGRLQPMDATMSEAQCLAAQSHNLGVMMLHNVDAIDDGAAALQLHNARRARIRSHPLADGDVLRRCIPHIRVALTFVWGSRDLYALPDLDGRIAYVRGFHPAARIEIIEGGGHWVMYERARACTAAILAAAACA